MLKFNIWYFILSLVIFVAEVLIARYLHGGFIRAYGGDFFVVILIYCTVKAFFVLPIYKTAFWVLIFAYVIEISQYFHLVSLLGLQNSRLAKIILGTTFSFIDLLTYTIGILFVLVCEYILRKPKPVNL